MDIPVTNMGNLGNWHPSHEYGRFEQFTFQSPIHLLEVETSLLRLPRLLFSIVVPQAQIITQTIF